MPFGLANVPAIFQDMINKIFYDIVDTYVIIYLDDILVYSTNPKEHSQHVATVLQRLLDYHLYVKLEKCLFDQDQIEFLRFVISVQGISMASDKVQSLLQWPIPSTSTAVMSFLGLANFYKRFIKHFSKLAYPLT